MAFFLLAPTFFFAVSRGKLGEWLRWPHFLAGLLLGGGAAVAADRETLKAARESEPSRADHLAFLGTVHSIAVAGLALIALSGVAMLLSDVERGALIGS